MYWGHSSAGRAPDLHSGGRRFDPVWLHHMLVMMRWDLCLSVSCKVSRLALFIGARCGVSDIVKGEFVWLSVLWRRQGNTGGC